MGKNIIICCDGTGNQYGKNNTNVVHLFKSLTYGPDQIIYYDPGVGTSSKLLLVPFQKISKIFSMAFGLDLQKNVEDAYYYLMNNYEEGDKIYLFGFSRGAHTVRRIASILEHVGLLFKGSDNMITFATQIYLNRERLGDAEVKSFKETFSRSCDIHFMGVWDTVSAISTLLPRPKLDGLFSKTVKTAFHAVALDEKRFTFPPNLWKQDSISSEQNVQEVWFSGVHSDVGGYDNERGLSNISLKWILENAVASGLQVKNADFENLVLNPKAPSHESWKGFWWVVPFPMYVILITVVIAILNLLALPLFKIWDVEWARSIFNFMWNFIKENWRWVLALAILLTPFTRMKRKVPPYAKIHKSVKERMGQSKYKPSNLEKVKDTIVWVD